MTAQILIVKPKTLNAADKAALRKAGVVVVESANPEDVKLIQAQQEMPASAITLAALKGLRSANDWNSSSQLFVRLMAEYMEQAMKESQ